VKAKSSCAPAAEAACAPSATAAPTAALPAPAEAGMRAYLDPETGVIGGLPATLEPAGTEGVQAIEPVLREEVLPDGSVMMDLQGTMQEYFLIQLDADGNRVVRCVQDPAKALATPVPAALPGVK